MIIEAILNLLYGFINIFMRLIPGMDWAFIPKVVDAFQNVHDLLVQLDFILPVNDFFMILKCIITLECFKWGFFIVSWACRRVRGG